MQLTVSFMLLLYLYWNWDWYSDYESLTDTNNEKNLEYNITIIDYYSPSDYWFTTTPGEVSEFEIYTHFLDSFFFRGDPKDYLLFELLVNDTVNLVFSTCEKRIELLCARTVISSFSIVRDDCPRTWRPRYILQAYSEKSVHIKLEISNIPKPVTSKQKIDQFRNETLASGFSLKNISLFIRFFDEVIAFIGELGWF